MDLLSSGNKEAIKQGFKSIADTLYRHPIVIKVRTTTVANKFGEGHTPSYTPISVLARVEYSKASGERYINVKDSPKGKDFEEGLKVFIWKETLDALLIAHRPINPEVDRVEVDGQEYEIRMFTPDNFFSTIGPLIYTLDLSQKGA
jgi:hypothetical protein